MIRREEKMARNPIARVALVALLAALAAGAPSPRPAAAQDCQVPQFVKMTNLPPNVMILFDNSDIMNEPVYHPDYDPWVELTGLFNENQLYYVAVEGFYTPRSFKMSWPSSPTAYLVASDQGQPGRYPGNYLNWIYYHATDAQRAALPTITRVKVAKAVAANVMLTRPGLNYGLTIFNQNKDIPGGQVIAECGSDIATILTALNGIAAMGPTPLGETMETVLNYYTRTDAGAPIEVSCQYNFLIVMAADYPTYDLDVSKYLWDADGDGMDPGSCENIGVPDFNALYFACSHHMDDLAYYMRHTDLRPDLGDIGESAEDGQTVITYVIGYGIDIPLFLRSATNGDGLYLTAANASELWWSLDQIILDIIERISAGAAVAVVSSEQSEEDYVYRAKFLPVKWNGFLEKFLIPVEPNEDPLWEADRLLTARGSGSRTLFTVAGGSVVPFDATQASTLRASLGCATDAEAVDLINWTRGDAVAGLRDREGHMLGDIIHSSPVVVGASRRFLTDVDFQTYLAETRTRPMTIYVGANDGMLHAFSAETGQETWGFVPDFALPKLATIADPDYCHVYTCDLSPTVVDAELSDGWHTVLISGGREGGSEYFALEVTDPAAPSVLWQTDLPDGVSFASDPLQVRIAGEPLVLVGSGLDETTGRAYLHAINLETGAVAGSLLLSESAGTRNKVTTSQAADLDYDTEVDVVYCSDLLGNLWRLEPAGSTNPSTWGKGLLFTQARPIMAQPAVAYGEDGFLRICFGTGAYIDEADVLTTDQQSFYVVKDARDGITRTRADLADRTDGTDVTLATDGWYIDLWHQAGERITERAVILAGAIAVTAFCPATELCTYGGHSWLYRLDLDSGAAPEDEDGVVLPREEDLGEGIASRPVVDLANEELVIQTSDATIVTTEIGVPISRLTVRSWQEDFDNVVGTQVEADSLTQ